MSCPDTCVLNYYLVFGLCTYDPTIRDIADADSLPVYRIYEEETGTAILSGEMAKLDDINTTGFYTEKILCNAVNGFEIGKTYTIYVEAVVSGVKMATSYSFRIIDRYKIPIASGRVYEISAGSCSRVYRIDSEDRTSVAQG